MKTVEVIERLWIPVFGFSLLIIVSLLARGIAINTITQEGSFGLEPLLIILSVVATKWADYAFRVKHDNVVPMPQPPVVAGTGTTFTSGTAIDKAA
jgi:hypothetical protein